MRQKTIFLIGLLLISCRAGSADGEPSVQRVPLRMVDIYRAELQPAPSVIKGVTTVADTLTDPSLPVMSGTPLTVPTMPALALGAEYLLHVRANGNDMGFFPATEQGGEVSIDRSLSEALGLPIKELSIEALQSYGRGAEVLIDLRRQELRIQSKTPFPFQSPIKNGEAGEIDKIRPKEKTFALKSVDFAASYTKAPDSGESQVYLAPSGRFLGGDLDLYYSSDGQPTRYKLGYRNEEREWLRSVDLGYLQHPVPFAAYSDKPAFSVSNIPLSRSGAILENYYLSEPIGTRVELWKEQSVITVYTIDTIPFLIPLPLAYSGNEYLLKIYRADGSIAEVNISREIGQEMLRPREVNYYIAAQQDEAPLGSVTLGLTNTLTLAAGITSGAGETVDPYAGARLRIPDGTIAGDISAAGNYIYRLNTTEGFSASHARTAATGNKDTTFTLTPNKLPWSPSLTLHLLESPEMVSLTEQFRLFIPYKSFYFNPAVQRYDTEGYSVYGLQAYWFLGARKLGMDLSYNVLSEQFDKEVTWFDSSYQNHQVEISAGERTENQYVSLRYNYRPTAGLAVGATYRLSEADYSIGLQVSGSFIPAAQKVIPQAVAQSGLIFVKITDASTGKPVSGAISIDGITHNLTVEGQELIPVTPYQYHRVRVIADFDYMADKQVFDLFVGKGEVTSLDIKMVPIEEVDGYIESKADGITVKLLDDSGATVAQTQTRFNGYYYFRIPKKASQYRVLVAEPKEVQIVKAD